MPAGRTMRGGGLIAGAAAGLFAGLALTAGRKMLIQGAEAAAGDWFAVLKAEHLAVLKLFDRMEQTTDRQASLRGMIFMKIKLGLSKHAFQEETVIYPAIRKADPDGAAMHLNDEHLEMKSLLSEAEQTDKSQPRFMEIMKSLRTLLEPHIREEEDQIFPALHASMGPDENRKLTRLMHKEGIKLA